MWWVLMVAAIGCGRVNFDHVTDATDAALVDGTAVDGWSRIIAGDLTTCGIFRGRAYCWGRGGDGEIGDGFDVDRLVPTAVAVPAGLVTDITQGEGHGCAIVDAAAYCWGNAPPGNGLPASVTPVAVTGLPSPVTAVAAGGGFACAVANGGAYCWGDDTNGALGNGGLGFTTTPRLVGGLPQPVSAIDAGNDHATVLLDDGTVWVWGHNDDGALGVGSFLPDSTQTPLQALVTGGLPALAGWHACAIVAGRARCWGRGDHGELGDGGNTSNPSPVDVTNLGTVTTIATGGGPNDFDGTCAVVAGATSCWGSGQFGRLGNGAATDSNVPVLVQSLPATTVELALGVNHTCARSSDGHVRCWGRGDLGLLGDGRGAMSLTPVLVTDP